MVLLLQLRRLTAQFCATFLAVVLPISNEDLITTYTLAGN